MWGDGCVGDSATGLLGSLLFTCSSERGGRNRATDESSEGDDRQRVRYHFDKLRRNYLRALQLSRLGTVDDLTPEQAAALKK